MDFIDFSSGKAFYNNNKHMRVALIAHNMDSPHFFVLSLSLACPLQLTRMLFLGCNAFCVVVQCFGAYRGTLSLHLVTVNFGLSSMKSGPSSVLVTTA